jgi:hypothetical protein
MIENYQFGKIKINGEVFDYDVEVRWNKEVLKWRRGESHIIDIEDVKRAVEQNPEKIVIGTGESGIAKATEEAQGFIKEKGVDLVIETTGKAVEVFNEEAKKAKRIIGLFHLTC